MLPASGFVNGCAFPTVADLAVLCMTDMAMPMGVAKQLAGGFPMVSATGHLLTTFLAGLRRSHRWLPLRPGCVPEDDGAERGHQGLP